MELPDGEGAQRLVLLAIVLLLGTDRQRAEADNCPRMPASSAAVALPTLALVPPPALPWLQISEPGA